MGLVTALLLEDNVFVNYCFCVGVLACLLFNFLENNIHHKEVHLKRLYCISFKFIFLIISFGCLLQ